MRAVYIKAPVTDHNGIREIIYSEPVDRAGDYNCFVRVRLAECCTGDEVEQVGYPEMLENTIYKKLRL